MLLWKQFVFFFRINRIFDAYLLLQIVWSVFMCCHINWRELLVKGSTIFSESHVFASEKFSTCWCHMTLQSSDTSCLMQFWGIYFGVLFHIVFPLASCLLSCAASSDSFLFSFNSLYACICFYMCISMVLLFLYEQTGLFTLSWSVSFFLLLMQMEHKWSCHWARGRIHPGYFTCSLKGCP